ncbi:hypothetical protein QEN19_003564 [Hanseniaspora menglaensis]
MGGFLEIIFKIILKYLLPAALALFFYVFFVEPQIKFSHKIPTIPFWVGFLPFFDTNTDQREIWFKYIEPKISKAGIAKIYFAGRWNLIVSDPEYMNQLLKNEQKIYRKSGNNVKIPKSLLSYYTGTNIISAHGKQWKKFRNIILPGLLNFCNYHIIFKNSTLFCNLIKTSINSSNNGIKEKNDSIYLLKPNTLSESLNIVSDSTSFSQCNSHITIDDSTHSSNAKNYSKTAYYSIQISEFVQRLSLANISEIALGFNIKTLEERNSVLYNDLNKIKKEIFKPLFMAFPFLDNLPINSRKNTRRSIRSFKESLFLLVQQNLIANYKYEQETYLNPAANLIKNHKNGILTKDELLDNLAILLIAGHENPQLLLTSLIYILGKYKEEQDNLRSELLALNIESYDTNTKLQMLSQSKKLNSLLYETIRLYPPIGQLVNRKTLQNCYMTSSVRPPIFIKKGTYIGYNNFGIQRSISIWGKNANDFKPNRWGSSIEEINDQWKKRKSAAEISAFHGGNRNCIGESIALNSMRITIWEMVKSFEWQLSEEWREKFTSAGPICPLNLSIKVKNICN